MGIYVETSPGESARRTAKRAKSQAREGGDGRGGQQPLMRPCVIRELSRPNEALTHLSYEPSQPPPIARTYTRVHRLDNLGRLLSHTDTFP